MSTHCAQEEEKREWEVSLQLSWSRGEIVGDFRSWNVSKESNALHNADHDSNRGLEKVGRGKYEGGIRPASCSVPFFHRVVHLEWQLSLCIIRGNVKKVVDAVLPSYLSVKCSMSLLLKTIHNPTNSLDWL